MLDTVTILRGIAALIIITIHAPLPASQINAPVGITIATTGFIGIYAFFFLSGFILGKRYLEGKYTVSFHGILTFYWKRFRKIAPLYYLVVLYIFFQAPSTTLEKIPELIRLFTFTASEKIRLSPASYLWFISTIMQMYIIAPFGFIGLDFLKKKTLRFRILLSVSVLILGAVIRTVFIPYSHYEFITQSLLMNIYIFLLGMTVSSWYKKISISPLWQVSIILFTAITFYLSLASVLTTNIQTIKLLHQTVIIPSLSYILFALILSIFPAKISVKTYFPLFTFQIIGIFSYEIYLLHQPVFNRLNLPCTSTCTPLIFITNIAIATAISLVLASGLRLVSKEMGKIMLYFSHKNV